MTCIKVCSYLHSTSLRWQKQLVHVATGYYQSSEVFNALKNSHVVLVLILIFLCTLWNSLFFKILCDYCSFLSLFYNLPVYSLCHFSIGLFIFLLIIWENSSHVLCVEKFPSNLSLCYHLCLCFWFWYLMFFEALIFIWSILSLFFNWLMCFFPLLNFSQFQGYPNSLDFQIF